MKKTVFLNLLFLTAFSSTLFSQLSNDKLLIKKTQNDFIRNKTQYIVNNGAKIQILQTCSINPESCGVMVFASTTMAKIINGKYSGDTILIAETCKHSSFKINNIYTVTFSFAPAFSVFLCSGQTYNPNWNYNIDLNKYLIFSCRMINSSKL